MVPVPCIYRRRRSGLNGTRRTFRTAAAAVPKKCPKPALCRTEKSDKWAWKIRRGSCGRRRYQARQAISSKILRLHISTVPTASIFRSRRCNGRRRWPTRTRTARRSRRHRRSKANTASILRWSPCRHHGLRPRQARTPPDQSMGKCRRCSRIRQRKPHGRRR